jgi:hypothetical protein
MIVEEGGQSTWTKKRSSFSFVKLVHEAGHADFLPNSSAPPFPASYDGERVWEYVEEPECKKLRTGTGLLRAAFEMAGLRKSQGEVKKKGQSGKMTKRKSRHSRRDPPWNIPHCVLREPTPKH